jgi:hypothetical protein
MDCNVSHYGGLDIESRIHKCLRRHITVRKAGNYVKLSKLPVNIIEGTLDFFPPADLAIGDLFT